MLLSEKEPLQHLNKKLRRNLRGWRLSSLCSN
ncbi:hypothetical protein Patl1_11483 [Pistacia atlantica]|uniref:Uncharacterized protein n=1 Tax=Pistacia atlantica TaxID=434234 RepID=A0ACC1A3D8_9ROSI|nr:hypothetical protein Patl1_11483 [Pistacia atlantica]